MGEEKGFTLIEVMITVAIVAVIAAAVYNAYFGSVRAWNYNKSRLEVQRVQDLTHRWISQYARQATYIDPEYTDIALTPDENILYLEYEDGGSTEKVAFGRDSNQQKDYLYFFNINTGAKKKISDLKFTDPDFSYNNGLIQINAGIINKEDNTTYQFSSYFNPRLVEITTP